jgi:C-terminal processing protease CtpA/Prc
MKKIIFILAVFVVIISCKKVFFKPDKASSDPQTNFEYLWNEVNKKYSYFELKNIDWDNIKVQYQAMISPTMGDEVLFNVLGKMLNELRDDHTNLISPFNISTYNLPIKKKPNYYARVIQEIMPDLQRTGAFSHSLIPNENIGYIRYGSFSDMFTSEQMDYVLKKYMNTKGIILDLRSNGGGAVMNVPLLLERFVDAKTLVAYSKTKNGPGKNDFGPLEKFYVDKTTSVRYTKPVIVLTDRSSYSATNFFALATKAIPNMTLMGDTTGGGGGLPNGGQLPNGWSYRFSISQLLDLQQNNYAEDGVPPEIYAEFNWNDLTRDEIIERAIQEFE